MRRKNKPSAKQDESVQQSDKPSTNKARSTKAQGFLGKAASLVKKTTHCCLNLSWWQCTLFWLGIGLTAYTVRSLPPQAPSRTTGILGHKNHLTACLYLQLYYVRAQISARDWIRPGRELWAEGLRPKHPVVVVPGMSLLQLQSTSCHLHICHIVFMCRFVTSGLELWHGHKCAENFFR